MVLDLTNDDINKNSIALKAHLDHRARKQEEAARQEDFEGRVEEVKRMANKPAEPVVETVEPYRLGSYRNPNGPPPSRREAVREAKKAERQAAADPEQRQGLPTRAKGSKKQGTVPKGTKPKKSAAPEDDHWGSSSVPDYEPEPVKQQKGGEFETPQEYMQVSVRRGVQRLDRTNTRRERTHTLSVNKGGAGKQTTALSTLANDALLLFTEVWVCDLLETTLSKRLAQNNSLRLNVPPQNALRAGQNALFIRQEDQSRPNHFARPSLPLPPLCSPPPPSPPGRVRFGKRGRPEGCSALLQSRRRSRAHPGFLNE